MASDDSSAHPGPPSSSEPVLITIDVLDQGSGMAEVEDSLGRTFELPAEWLPDAAEGLAYRVHLGADSVRFEPLQSGARELRERSKQTLLEFSDEHESGEHRNGEHGAQP